VPTSREAIGRSLLHLIIVSISVAFFAGCGGSSLQVSPPIGMDTSFQAGHKRIPSPGWQFPYDPNPFTVPICASDPCSPSLDPNSASIVSFIMTEVGGFSLGQVQEAEPGTNGQGQTSTFPTFWSSPRDPAYTVTCDKFGGCSSFFPSTIRIPNGAHASIDNDHHMTVIDLTDGYEYDFWEFNDNGTGTGTTTPVSGGGNVSTAFGDICQITSYASMGHCQGSSVNAATAVWPGMIDPREWVSAAQNNGISGLTNPIYVAVPCPSPDYIWPANQSSGQCSYGPLLGERVWLDLTDAEINALSVYPWTKVFLHTMHDYGLMVVDSSGGGTPWNLYGIDNATMTLWGKTAPWTAFFTEVTNEGDGGNLDYADNASHLVIPTTGISQSNIHIALQP
jgi:hypothetical protein